jgi:hypothetical protein
VERSIDLVIDVTAPAHLGEPAHVALTVTLPEPSSMPSVPIICFAKPGGGYSARGVPIGLRTLRRPRPAE